MYDVFVRTWWRRNPAWPNGREPHLGKKRYLARGLSQEEARSICAQWSRDNKPGPLSRKAEYEEAQ